MKKNKYDVDEEVRGEFNLEYFKRFFGYLKPQMKSLFIITFLMLISSAVVLVGPYIVKDAIDVKIPNKDIRGLIILSFVFLAAILINAICVKYRIRLVSNLAQNIIVNIRRDIFSHIQKLSFAYFDSRPLGKILVRVVNYVNSLNQLLSDGIVNLISDLFTLLFIVVYMLLIDVKLTLISMVGLPLLAMTIFLLKNIQKKRWQLVSKKQANMNAYIHESISGMKITRSFSREKENEKIFNKISSDFSNSWIKASAVSHLIWPISENFSTFSISLLFLLGVSWISKGTAVITIGTLIAFVGYISRFWDPITRMAEFYNQIIFSITYLERIFETMDEEIHIKDAPNAYEIPEIKGEVIFRNVRFSYDEEKQILKDISFKVDPGETIALVGSTGSGKTTIINLITRFYDIQGGEILIDGHNIANVKLSSLRRQIGVMMQDTFLFSGTVMDNIRYGRLDATDEEVVEAAKTVQAHEFIMQLENGYYTEVNERGSRLSVGQRQLISFARTILASPKILILDEATSSIDTKTEIALQKGLKKMLDGRTSFVIAHRLSTIKNADRIFFIDNGLIVEAGSHTQLMKSKGLYYRLLMSQYNTLGPDRVS